MSTLQRVGQNTALLGRGGGHGESAGQKGDTIGIFPTCEVCKESKERLDLTASSPLSL